MHDRYKTWVSGNRFAGTVGCDPENVYNFKGVEEESDCNSETIWKLISRWEILYPVPHALVNYLAVGVTLQNRFHRIITTPNYFSQVGGGWEKQNIYKQKVKVV